MVDGSGLHLQRINRNHIHKANRYKVATHTITCTRFNKLVYMDECIKTAILVFYRDFQKATQCFLCRKQEWPFLYTHRIHKNVKAKLLLADTIS